MKMRLAHDLACLRVANIFVIAFPFL
jgi:hypothetical protein